MSFRIATGLIEWYYEGEGSMLEVTKASAAMQTPVT